MSDKSYYLEFVDQWMDRPENKGRSFTYWSAMYDWIKEHRFSFDDLWIDYDVRESIQSSSWASSEWVDYLSDEAIAEILDIAELDEYGRQIQDEYDEELKDEIADELDWEEFKTREDFEDRVKELCKWSGLYWDEVADEIEYYKCITILDEQEEDGE